MNDDIIIVKQNRYDKNDMNDVNLTEQLKVVLLKEHLKYPKGERVANLIDNLMT